MNLVLLKQFLSKDANLRALNVWYCSNMQARAEKLASEHGLLKQQTTFFMEGLTALLTSLPGMLIANPYIVPIAVW